MLRYRLINIIKPTKFYFLYTSIYMIVYMLYTMFTRYIYMSIYILVYDRLHAHRILPPQKDFFNY